MIYDHSIILGISIQEIQNYQEVSKKSKIKEIKNQV